MNPTPLLIISDMPTAPTGLARIAGDLAERIHLRLADTFRVAVCGYGASTSRHIKYPLYPVQKAVDWTLPQLPEVWYDFAGQEYGIIFAIWNASWLDWLVRPDKVLPNSGLKDFLMEGGIKKWIYAPIDAEGPAGRLPDSQRQILQGFDRVLAYTAFGAQVIANTTGLPTPHLPHGMDVATFFPGSQAEARERFLPHILSTRGRIDPETFLIGAVATNTPRKDWGLCFETCGELLRRGENVGLWVHTDQVQKAGAWDLRMLAEEFGMLNRTIFTNGHVANENLAWGYRACDVVFSIGSGEGWGYCAAEALACGIPTIHGNYAGSTEFIPQQFLVEPVAYRLDGYYGNRRPVFKATDWADKAMFIRGTKAELDPKFSWAGCWPAWEQWLLEGIK